MEDPQSPMSNSSFKLEAANPCNEFIVDYLLRNSISYLTADYGVGFDYHTLISAVQKYPVPLICAEQLAALEGFDSSLVGLVAKVMRRQHLRKRSATPREQE